MQGHVPTSHDAYARDHPLRGSSVVGDVQDDLASLAALTDAGGRRPQPPPRAGSSNRSQVQHASVGARSELDELSVVRIDYEIRDARCLFGDGNEARGRADRPIGHRHRRCRKRGRTEVTHGAVGAEHADTLVFTSRPWSKRPCQALSPASASAALSTCVRRPGLGASTSAGTTASAATPSQSNGVSAKTSSSAAKPRAWGPIATIPRIARRTGWREVDRPAMSARPA
jgi:hypothetical protein